jgi:threonine 3-dehydrogenase
MLSIPSEEDPAGSLRANAIGTFNVLEAARLFDVRQVLFSSSVATYAGGIEEDVISDNTIQRPSLFYGATKVFGEHMGLFYKRRYGLDFRGLRYPSIVGPNVTTPAVVQFTSWVIEQCARGNPFTIPVTPEAQVPILYYKDADRAMIELGSAPESSIDTVIYNIGGIKPVPSAGQLADEVVKHVPDAKIKFEPDPDLMVGLGGIPPMDDQRAQDEWNWRSEYDLVQMVDDFIAELNI